MDYAKTLRRAFDILIAHKYLIVMGVLAAFSGSSNYSYSGGGNSGSGDTPPPATLPEGFEAPDVLDTIIPSVESLDWLWVLPVMLIVGLIVFAILIGMVLWAIGAVAQGGLIAGVNNAEVSEEDATTFGQAWAAGWANGWRLIGISLVPLLPMLLLLGLSIATVLFTVGLSALSTENIGAILGSSVVFALVCMLCLVIPIIIVIDVFRIFALRACMLDETGVFASYQRGWQVVKDNLGSALILLLLRLGLALLLGFLLFLPTIMMSVCCFLWPLMLLINGTITAYFSTVWTLAWRQWTGMTNGGSANQDAGIIPAG